MRLPTTESVIYEKSARSDDADIGYKRSVLILFFVRRSKQAAPLLSSLWNWLSKILPYLLGPLPRSDNPSQATYTLGTCQTSMMCRLMADQICVRS